MPGAVEVERHDGTRNFIRTVLRPLPRNGGTVRLLICPYCQIPRRGLYGWVPGGRFTSGSARGPGRNSQWLLMPGIALAMILYRNPHLFSLWVVEGTNVVSIPGLLTSS